MQKEFDVADLPYYKACRMWRESAKMTQKEVANEFGCSQQLISAFENGISNTATLLWWYLNKFRRR